MTKQAKMSEIFPSYVYTVRNLLPESVFKEIQNTTLELEKELNGSQHNFDCEIFSTIRSGHNIGEDRRFLKLNKAMANEASTYLQKLNVGLLAATGNGWLNCYTKDFYQELHVHPGASVSGVFYVNTPEGSAPITFTDTHFRFIANIVPADIREENLSEKGDNPFYGSIRFPCEENMAVFFLSDQPHRVGRSTNKEVRRSIAYNYDLVTDPNAHSVVGDHKNADN